MANMDREGIMGKLEKRHEKVLKERYPITLARSPLTAPGLLTTCPMPYLHKPLILKTIWRWPGRMARLFLDFWNRDKI